MSKKYQKYFFLLSIGLLPLALFVTGCNGCTPKPHPKPEVRIEETKEETVEIAQPVEPVIPEPVVIEQPTVVEPTPMPVEPVVEPEPVIEPVKTPEPVVEEPAPQPAVEEKAEEPSSGVRTDGPVDQTSPVNEMPPINTESPVDTASPVQGGGLSLLFVRWLPFAILALQDEQPQTPDVPQTATESELVPEEQISDEAQPTPPETTQSAGEQNQYRESSGLMENQRSDNRSSYGDRGSRGGYSPSSSGRGGYPPSSQQGYPQQTSSSRRGAEPQATVVQEPRLEPAGGIRFNFRYAPWKDVIEWFVDQAGLSLQADKMPTGTFNMVSGDIYTSAEGLDILNSYLLWKDYSLLRKGKSLFLVYLPDGIPPNLLEPIEADELDSRGKYEICKCVFNLNRTAPEVIQAEIEKTLGPQGSIVLMPKSQQIVITETGGMLRAIRNTIRRIDDPDGTASAGIQMVETKNLPADEALQMMRKLLVIEETDPSLRTVVDSSGRKVLLSGRGDMVEKAKDVIDRIDKSFGSDDPAMAGTPQYDVLDTGVADPTTAFSILQTLLVGTPDVRLSLDPKTGVISILARPAAIATAREALKQMQLNVPQIDIIPLKRLSPLSAVESIKKFIATSSPALASTSTGSSGDRRSSTVSPAIQPPTVEADTAARQIIVRGTISQIAEIRALLAKLGEDGIAGPPSDLATVRAIPLSPTATALVLEQLQSILPKLDPKIKVVVPSIEEEKEKNVDSLIDETFETEPPMTRWQRMTDLPILAQVVEIPQSEVVVTVTSAGIMISSDDPEALSKVEEVIRMLSDESVLGKMELKVYNLTYSTAAVVASTLQTLMGAGNTAGGVTGAGSVDLPEWQNAEVLGLLAAQANSIEKTGTVTITPDERLNALYIQANLVDHKTIEKLLKILDVPKRDDILKDASPRLIQLANIRAEEAKTAVEQVFANRMQGSSGSSSSSSSRGSSSRDSSSSRSSDSSAPPGGPPQAMMMMGGPGGEMMRQIMDRMGRSGSSSTPREQEPPMTLSVHAQSNSLIVNSSEALFLEVRGFVEAIDAAALQTSTIMETVPLTNISTSLAQQTLSNMFGNSVTFRSTPTSQGTYGSTGFGGSSMSPFSSSSGFRPSSTFGTSPFGNSSPFGSSGFRPSTFGGSSPFGGGNPFMSMMSGSPTGGSGMPMLFSGSRPSSTFGSSSSPFGGSSSRSSSTFGGSSSSSGRSSNSFGGGR